MIEDTTSFYEQHKRMAEQSGVFISEAALKELEKEKYLKQLEAELLAKKKEEVDPFSSLQKQVGGDHYKKLGLYQPWEVLARWLTPEELAGYMKGTVIAYLCRNKENPVEDWQKAMHVMQLYFELSEKVRIERGEKK